ncbi:MAG TPA: peptidoglycan-binding protein, partial [Firmicutes bacterium]|nr:peptidoglycan-binding protein [Bacillota bacterium]
DQPVHHMHLEVNFLANIRIPGAVPGLMAEIFPSVEFVQVTIVNPKTVMQDLILSIFVKVTEIQQLRVVTDVKSDRIPINAVRQLVAIEDVVNEKSQQINIRREVEIPEEKPPAQKILQIFSSTVEITRADILDGKIILEGVLVLQIIYVAAEEDQPVHHAHVEIPFTSFVDMPGAYPGMNVLVRPRVEFVTVQFLPVGVTPPPD